jgi:hypothetical protein
VGPIIIWPPVGGEFTKKLNVFYNTSDAILNWSKTHTLTWTVKLYWVGTTPVKLFHSLKCEYFDEIFMVATGVLGS